MLCVSPVNHSTPDKRIKTVTETLQLISIIHIKNENDGNM